MYKITNLTFGEIKINNKKMGYKVSTIVENITSELSNLAANKLIKIKFIEINKPEKIKEDISNTLFEEPEPETKKNKKNKDKNKDKDKNKEEEI